jgi:transcription elongation factor GreA
MALFCYNNIYITEEKMAKVYMTKEKIKELEKELHYLRTKKRKEVADKIAEARSHGDLSENADYDAAKDEQGLLEMKISKISQTLANSEAIKANEFPDDKVYILSKVKIRDIETDDVFDYQLVSAEEADFAEGKISITSPIGKALMGKKLDEIVEITVPAGIMKYKVEKIGK